MIRFSAHNHDILRLALPSIVQNVTVPLLGLADVTIMGHIGDARHIGAIAVGSMIFNVMYWLCAFLRAPAASPLRHTETRSKGMEIRCSLAAVAC